MAALGVKAARPALQTHPTDGFIYVPTANGKPTYRLAGGASAMVLDVNDGRTVWYWDGSEWLALA
jgi:hypothetical protein